MLTMFTEEHYVFEALRAGVSGYVLKTKAAGELVEAIRVVIKGETYLGQDFADGRRRLPPKAMLPVDPLTARQRQVIQLVAEGKTTKEVASLLGISVKTADSHRTNLMEKLDIHDVAGMV